MGTRLDRLNASARNGFRSEHSRDTNLPCWWPRRALLATLGVAAGVCLTYVLLLAGRPLLENRFGVFVEVTGLSETDLTILAVIVLAALLMGLLAEKEGFEAGVGSVTYRGGGNSSPSTPPLALDYEL